MKQATYILTDENGIHARPAGVITQMAKRSLSSITLRIRENGRTADAGKLFSVMALGGHAGDTLEIIAEGEDEENIVAGLLAELKRIGL